MKKALSIVETAAYLGISPPIVYGLVRSGKLPAARAGRQWRLLEETLVDFLRGGGSGGGQGSETKSAPAGMA